MSALSELINTHRLIVYLEPSGEKRWHEFMACWTPPEDWKCWRSRAPLPDQQSSPHWLDSTCCTFFTLSVFLKSYVCYWWGSLDFAFRHFCFVSSQWPHILARSTGNFWPSTYPSVFCWKSESFFRTKHYCWVGGLNFSIRSLCCQSS